VTARRSLQVNIVKSLYQVKMTLTPLASGEISVMSARDRIDLIKSKESPTFGVLNQASARRNLPSKRPSTACLTALPQRWWTAR